MESINILKTMILRIKRTIFNDRYTIGRLYVGDKYFCDTLEDRDRGLEDSMSLSEIQSRKIYGQTAIPKGTYEITLDTVSPKFKDRSWAQFCNGKLPRLKGVKGFEGVLMHVGNRPENTLGCVLVGKHVSGGYISESSVTFRRLYSILQDHKDKGEILTVKIE